MTFPLLTANALAALERHNQRWTPRWTAFQARVPWPGSNAILPRQDEWRWTVEAYLPFQEFRRSLAAVFRAFLPETAWMPAPLRCRTVFLQDQPLPAMPAFLTEFWDMLPEWLAGKVTYTSDELLPLACSLADPPRFGTDSGRYPRQLALFKSLLASFPDRPVHILDIGCGIGLGTYELSSAAEDASLDCLGITPEPLEVWMAENRFLPHDRRRQTHFPSALPDGSRIHFQVGTAEHLPDGLFDVIVCNGLVGGRFLDTPAQFDAFLHQCSTRTHSDGHLLVSNHFHDGFLEGCQRFMLHARQSSWSLQSDDEDLRNIHLRPSPRKTSERG